MRTYILIALFIITFFNMSAQTDSLLINKYEDYLKTIDFNISGGVLIPHGKLKDFFGVSPFVELSVDFPLKREKSLEFALQFVIPDQKDEFVFLRVIDTVQAKASFMFNPMLRFKKNLLRSSESKLNIGLGIGASIIRTDTRNPFFDGDRDNEKFETITALLVEPGISYSVKFKNNDQLSFGVYLQYSPYKVEGALQQNIGSVFYKPRLSYRF